MAPKNWRPISLLNCGYKIASRGIAGRLLKVIHLVVEKDQTCGIPGRFIGENVAFLRNVVDYTTLSDVPLLFYLSTKKRRLTEWTGISCVPLSVIWASVPHSLVG